MSLKTKNGNTIEFDMKQPCDLKIYTIECPLVYAIYVMEDQNLTRFTTGHSITYRGLKTYRQNEHAY